MNESPILTQILSGCAVAVVVPGSVRGFVLGGKCSVATRSRLRTQAGWSAVAGSYANHDLGGGSVGQRQASAVRPG
jgi:hypothetical protein